MKTVIFLLFFPLVSFANDWSTSDTYREFAWHGINYIDYLQTSHISHSCHHNGVYYEQNPILSKCPTQGDVDKYFFVSGVTHTAISIFLPVEFRSIWQYISIGFSSAIVVNNYYIGLRINF